MNIVVDMWYYWGLRWISSERIIEGVGTKTGDLVGYGYPVIIL